MARLERAHQGESANPAIVFIHGLGGDLFDTWVGPGTSPDDCWLNWVGTDTGCDTWTLEYDSALSRWHEQAMPLPDQGTQVAQLLAVHQGLRDKALVLVGHSMGGLVIKSLVTQTQAAGDVRARALLSRIKGIVFVATPHQGSQLASLATALSGIARTNAQVGDMSGHDPHLRQLSSAFREQRRTLQMSVAAFAETRDVVWQRKGFLRFLNRQVGLRVVDPSSSDPGLEGVTTVPLAEDHFSICKPASRDAHIHHALVAFLRDEILTPTRVLIPEPESALSRELEGGTATHGAAVPPSEHARTKIAATSDGSTATPNPVALALFDIYTSACSPYYAARTIDKVASDTLAVRSLWLTGQSGVGKTSLVRRYIDQKNIHPIEISFSQLGTGSTQLQITREIVEAVAATTGVAAKGFDLLHAVEALAALPAETAILLFIDEIPVGLDTNVSTVQSTIGLLIDAIKRQKGSRVRFIACSIDTPLTGTVNGKFREAFAVTNIPPWTTDELKSLLVIVQANCGIVFQPSEIDLIIEAAAGSPRYVKTLVRNMLQRQSNTDITHHLRITSAELQGL